MTLRWLEWTALNSSLILPAGACRCVRNNLEGTGSSKFFVQPQTLARRSKHAADAVHMGNDWMMMMMMLLWRAERPQPQKYQNSVLFSHGSTFRHRPSSLSPPPSEFPPSRHLRQRVPLPAAEVGREIAAGREPASLRSDAGDPNQ